jgi:predicted porin
MQKKLLAVAVVGVLTAPMAAMAQSSVTVSGNINIWYETAGATGATNTCPTTGCTVSTFDVKSRDRVQDGNGSNIRFAAVEDVGSGMQAFAQVETAVINNSNTRNDAVGTGTAVTTLQNAGGWGTRNSGVGLRGQAWGEVLIGVWDVHYNEQYGSDGLLIKAASHDSMLGLMNSFGTAGSATSAGGVGGLSIGARYSNVLRYQSPNWGGFSFRVAYARPTDGVVPTATSTAFPNVVEGTKNKVINFAPQFNMGGIHVGFSYLKDSDIAMAQSTLYTGATVYNQTGQTGGALGPVLGANGATVGSAGVSNLGTVTSNRLFGAYSFPFGLKVGLVIDQSKVTIKSTGNATQTFGSTEAKRTVWGIPLVYTIGAHTIGASYAQASKLSGSVGQLGATSIGISDVGVVASGAAAGAAPQSVGENSKAQMYVLAYTYDLSKRTNIHVSFAQIKNASLAGYDFFANGVGMSTNTFGADPRIYSLGLRHAF